MSLSTLPLSYCTNVHPGLNVSEVIQGLQQYTIPTQDKLNRKIAAGLWLPATAIDEIANTPAQFEQLRDALHQGNLTCYTLNTFPFGNFHSERVKDQVYLPDWSTPDRLNYTVRCAQLLEKLMPEGVEGSLSTVPLGFKGHEKDEDFLPECIDQLLNLAATLDDLHDETGRVVRLAVEPEPLCILETTTETIEFFRKLFDAAITRGQLDVVKRHIGVCYDVCHQSVEFENVKESIQKLAAEDIRINKVHITCALRLESPANNPEARSQLASFVEQRYLHQTFIKTGDQIQTVTDLSEKLCLEPDEDGILNADEWRIHFHVPVNQESQGLLGTTRNDLKLALEQVAELDYAPHLEVETYTWNVLPGGEQLTLIEGLTSELSATYDLIETLREAT